MKKILVLVLLGLGFSGLRQIASAQVAIDTVTPYTQNFDSFGTNNTAWTDNVKLLGWYLIRESGTVAFLTESDGGSGGIATYNYGTVADPDRALGSIADAADAAFYGLRFTNSTFLTITNIVINYTGEQWRVGNLNDMIPDKLQFFFRVGGTDFLADINNVGWTAAPTLDFNSPQNPGGGIQILDGNNPTNQVAVAGSIPVNLAPGQEIWLRWFDEDDQNGDHGLAIDDLSVQFQGQGFIISLPFNATVELKKPKLDKSLTFKGAKGFPFKALIKTTNAVTTVSYFAFGGTNQPTNAVYTAAGKLKEFKKGKKFKQGYRYMAKHKGKTNKPGIGIEAGASPVTLIVKVQGTNAQLTTNFVFSDVKVK